MVFVMRATPASDEDEDHVLERTNDTCNGN